VPSLFTGVRTEELRALTWSHVDLDGEPDADPPLPPHIDRWTPSPTCAGISSVSPGRWTPSDQ